MEIQWDSYFRLYKFILGAPGKKYNQYCVCVWRGGEEMKMGIYFKE